jgi:hypothetical protein
MSGFTFITPIKNVIFDKSVKKKQLQIDRVLLVSKQRLPYIRKKLNISKPLSKLKFRDKVAPSFLSMHNTYAIIRSTNVDKESYKVFFSMVKDAINILSLGELGWSKRQSHSLPLIHSFNDVGRYDYMIINNDQPVHFPGWSLYGNIMPLYISSRWYNYHRHAFFLKLLKIINKDIFIEKSWYDTIYRTTIIAGQSQSSKDLVHAFLCNIMVLEALLTKQGDKYLNILPKRIENFIGWVGYWTTENYEEKIRELYKKRCKIIHDCNYSDLSVEDLLFSDDLILNVFDNIINHIDIFKSKDDILDFTKKIEAEHILGINSKTSPKSLRFFHRTYTDKDKEKIY